MASITAATSACGASESGITCRIISIVTVYAPDRYAAVTVARAVVSDALRHLAASPGGAHAGTQTPPPSAA